jgi:hypothetical protein
MNLKTAQTTQESVQPKRSVLKQTTKDMDTTPANFPSLPGLKSPKTPEQQETEHTNDTRHSPSQGRAWEGKVAEALVVRDA